MRDDEAAERLKALAHPARLAIVKALAERSCCCQDVCGRLPLAQSTVSQHLKVLVDSGLVRLSSRAQRSFYEIDSQAMASVSSAFAGLAARCCLPNPESESRG